MNNQKLMCAGLLAIAVITIVILVILLVKCHNGDNYEHHNCGTCQGLGDKVCVNRPKLHSLYDDGILTETSNLVRGKQWPVTMPDDQWEATNGRETSPGWSKSFGDLEAYEGVQSSYSLSPLINDICRPSTKCNNTELGVHVNETDYCCPKKWTFGNITNGVCQKMPDMQTDEHWIGCTTGSSSDCSACGDDASCKYYPNFNSQMCLFHSAN